MGFLEEYYSYKYHQIEMEKTNEIIEGYKERRKARNKSEKESVNEELEVYFAALDKSNEDETDSAMEKLVERLDRKQDLFR